MNDDDKTIIQVFRDYVVNDPEMTLELKTRIVNAIQEYHCGLPFVDDQALANKIFDRIFDIGK